MKLKLDTVRLHFNTPLHISNVRGDYNTTENMVHSDTLHAAIMQAWAALGKQEWIRSEPDYSLSSLFPFTNCNGQYVYFFRKPFHYIRQGKEMESEQVPGLAKKYKKVMYFDKDYFEAAIQGNFNLAEEDIRGVYLTGKEIYEGFISSHVTPRIRWPRNEAEDTEIFYMERLYFAGNSGLYFIIHANDEWQDKINIALKYLADSGLGTDRAIGNGRFTFSFDHMELMVPDSSDYSMNLSVFCPDSRKQLTSLLGDKAGYEIIRRGGWMGEPHNTYRKKSIFMFNEGSVFCEPTEGIKTLGRTVDLRPESTPNKVQHPVYRVGRSIFIPIKV